MKERTDKRARERAGRTHDPAKGGKPSLLTPERQRIICAHMQIGGYLDDAAHLAGIHTETLAEWIGRGNTEIRRRETFENEWGSRETPVSKASGLPTTQRPMPERRAANAEDNNLRALNEKYVQLTLAVQEAQAVGAASMLASITKAGTGGIVLSVTTTERTMPDGTIERSTTERKAPPDWRAAAFRLERRNPKKWGPNARVELGGNLTVNTWADLAMIGEKASPK